MKERPAARSCIFLADDDATVRLATGRWLGRQGYAVYLFESGEALLEALEARLPDLVVVDLHMPGASGLDVVQVVRATAPRVPVILWSADAVFEDQRAALQAGAYAYVVKGHDLQALGTTVYEALRSDSSPLR